MSKGAPYHRHPFERLLHAAEDLPGGALIEQGAEAVERQVDQGWAALTHKVGGRARITVVILLASVLAMSSADTGAVSAVAPKLESALHIGNVDIGLLVTVSALTAALGMLPVGWVADRWPRTKMVTGAVVLWGVAEIVSAVSPDYTFLLVVRLALGALTAVTGPTLASLTGDLFPARERSQIYGYILTGELLGAGLGLLIAGLFSAWFTWRVAFAVLAIPSFFLAWQFHTRMPEPARGGQSRLERGAEQIVAAEDVEDGSAEPSGNGSSGPSGALEGAATAAPAQRDDTAVTEEVERRHIDPRKGVVLDRDPMDLGWWEAFRYVVAVPSNVTLILASALGYFFFTGVETFALIYIEGHYGVSQTEATFVTLAVGAAAVGGAIIGGRSTDTLLHKGHVDARLIVPAAAFVLAAAVFIPAVISASLYIAVPLFLVAGFCIAAPNPGLDAARLDIMPSRMWGRAEAVRSMLRSLLQAFAPLIFGLVSTLFGGHGAGFARGGISTNAQPTGAAGLQPTFILMLGTLLLAAFFVWRGRALYLTDVAAAAETEKRFPAASAKRAGAAQSAATAP
ncbi:MAG: MFS transporter [Acidimicrobiales bacterium]